jgi:uncharacterized protein
MVENLYKANSIRTRSGRYVDMIDPDPETLELGDIAHALSRVPRFGGHLPWEWSVAQHSLLVASMVPAEHKLQALLHDASEAFLCDIPSPLKAHLPEYKTIEQRMMQAIATRFGMQWPMADEIKVVDTLALEMEWKYLMLGTRDNAPDQHRITSRLSLAPYAVQQLLRLQVEQAMAN